MTAPNRHVQEVFSPRPSTHGTTFPYCAEASPGSSWIFLQIHAGIAMPKPPRPDDIVHGLDHHPQAKTNCLGPSDISLRAATISQPLAKSYHTFLTLNVNDPLYCGFVTWIFLPPPPGSLKVPETFQIQAKKHFVDPAQSGIMRPPHRATPTLSDHLPTCHLQHLIATCGWQLWGFPNGSVRVTQHLLSVPCFLRVTKTKGVGTSEASVLISETCL